MLQKIILQLLDLHPLLLHRVAVAGLSGHFRMVAMIFLFYFFVEKDFYKGLVGNILFIGHRFESVQKRLRKTQRNRLGRRFKARKGDVASCL